LVGWLVSFKRGLII